MAPNRITRGGAALATVILALIMAGCGGGSSSTGATTTTTAAASSTDVATHVPSSDESADAALLDEVLGRQEAAVSAFRQVAPTLPPRQAAMAAWFRRQEQEHIDAILKALRGLQSPPEPSGEAIEPGPLKTDRERLEFLYEVEGSTIDAELSAISKLEASWPRSLLASTVADQAQHLVLLRRALGAGPLGQIPEAFENGTHPPPVG